MISSRRWVSVRRKLRLTIFRHEKSKKKNENEKFKKIYKKSTNLRLRYAVSKFVGK